VAAVEEAEAVKMHDVSTATGIAETGAEPEGCCLDGERDAYTLCRVG
jgi:hypothetical protein